jgi:predicted regulator of Ras-like GTPase activity (Roadblock/LC7/MglB family)
MLEGDLEKYPISKIFNFIYYEELSGKLRLTYDEELCDVLFNNGKIKEIILEGYTSDDAYEEIMKWDKGEFKFTHHKQSEKEDNLTEAKNDIEKETLEFKGKGIEKEKGSDKMELEDMKESQLLRYIVSQVDGALSAGLSSMDGLTIDVYNTLNDLDTTAADAEFASMLHSSKNAVKNLGPAIGDVEELILTGEKAMIICRMIGDEYFTALTLKKNGNLGKARLFQKKIVKIMYPKYYG